MRESACIGAMVNNNPPLLTASLFGSGSSVVCDGVR